MLDTCSTCLCKERRLFPLLFLNDILTSLSWLNLQFSEGDQVCWECKAMFTKVYSFRQQAWKAQELMRLHTQSVQHSKCLPNLSNLSSTIKSTYDEMICYDDIVKEEIAAGEDSFKTIIETDIGEEITVKTEKKSAIVRDLKGIGDDFVISSEESVVQEAENYTEEERIDHDAESPKLKQNGARLRLKNLQLLLKNGLNKHHMSKEEEKFVVRKMSHEEMDKARDIDRKQKRYVISPFKCVKCITGYFKKEKYDFHVKKQHLESAGKFACPICEVRFKRKEGLEYHHDCHFRSYQCRQCPYDHHRLNTMLIHFNKLHERKNYECKFCGREFFGNRQLRYHVDKAHGRAQECELCSKTFSTASSLKFHMKIHENTLVTEECPTCGGMYRYLRSHMRTHQPATENAYCAECDRQYKSVQCYKRHLEYSLRHRPPDAKAFECPDCDTKFITKNQMARHVAAKHTKEFPFYCDACGKGFVQKFKLKHHIMEKHQGIPRPKDKICTYCGKGFKESQTLRVHLRVHTGEKPFKCASCPWRFSQSSALKTHVRALHLKTAASDA